MLWTALGFLMLTIVLGAAAIRSGGNARSAREANQTVLLGFAAAIAFLATIVLGTLSVVH